MFLFLHLCSCSSFNIVHPHTILCFAPPHPLLPAPITLLYRKRTVPAVDVNDMCGGCLLGEGPCRNVDVETTCRGFVYDPIEEPICPAGFRECRLETTTSITTTTTSATATITTTTTATTSTATTTTTTTVMECEYETVAGTGPCIYVLPGNKTHLRFEETPGGGCLPGLLECRGTTTSSTTTATSTTTTTVAACHEACTDGYFGDCRGSSSSSGGGEVTCGTPGDSILDRTGQCIGTTDIDCRPPPYTDSDLFPQNEGERLACSDCAGYTINGMGMSDDNKLMFFRGSFGNCKHKKTGVCLLFNDGGECWPGTYDCAAAYTCAAAGAATCCACTASAAGPTAGPCQHPETGRCMGMYVNSKGIEECLPGMTKC